MENIGTGAASEVAAVDLIIIVEPGEAVQYGWIGGMGEEPSTDLLPVDTIAAMLRLLDDLPIDSMEAATRFARFDGQTWLLAITRVLPYKDGLPARLIDEDLPRHLFGTRIDDALMSALGGKFLVDDLMIAQEPVSGMAYLPLGDISGFGGYAVWTPNHPGNVILRKIAIPLILIFGMIALVSALVSRHVVRSAKRLERAGDAAQAADRSKTEFLANVSHELRTPMNGIIGMGQLIQSMELAPNLAKMVGVLMTSAQSQMVLIEALLDVARIDSGNRQLDHSPFDPVAADVRGARYDGAESRRQGRRPQCRSARQCPYPCSGGQGLLQASPDKPDRECSQVYRSGRCHGASEPDRAPGRNAHCARGRGYRAGDRSE
jgi:hypothetical protein